MLGKPFSWEDRVALRQFSSRAEALKNSSLEFPKPEVDKAMADQLWYGRQSSSEWVGLDVSRGLTVSFPSVLCIIFLQSF